MLAELNPLYSLFLAGFQMQKPKHQYIVLEVLVVFNSKEGACLLLGPSLASSFVGVVHTFVGAKRE